MRQERGLVAAIPRRRFEIARQQIRRVGLEQHAVERHLGERIAERVPAPLVAEPAGDADIKPEVEIAAELDPAAGEAVRDAADDPADERLEQRDEALVRVALMQENGLPGRDRELELRDERVLLPVARREVAVEIESALADGDDFGSLE